VKSVGGQIAVAVVLAVWSVLCVSVAPVAAQSKSPARGSAATASTEAVGDGRDFWLLRPDPLAARIGRKGYVIHHRRSTDEVGILTRGPQIIANVGLETMAAGHGRLWLVWEDLSIQSVRVIDGQTPPGSKLYPPPISERALPGDPSDPDRLKVKSVVAGRSGLWALVEVDDLKKLQFEPKTRAGQSKSSENDSKESKSQQKDKDESKTEAKDAPDKNAEPSSASKSKKINRLLHLERDQWTTVPLPVNWPDSAAAWLVHSPTQSDRPILLTVADSGSNVDLWLYEYDPQASRSSTEAAADTPVDAGASAVVTQGVRDARGWKRTVFHSLFSGSSSRKLSLLTLQGQVIVGRRIKGEKLTVDLTVLRPDVAVPLGTLSFKKKNEKDELDWQMTGLDQAAALVVAVKAGPSSGQVTAVAMNLQGAIVQDSLRLKEKPIDYYTAVWPFLVLVTALVIATIDLLIFWRRDETRQRIEIPKDITMADVGSRAAAGVIDLAPGFLLAMLLFQKSLPDILTNWPGYARPGDVQSLLPGVVVIVTYVAHTCLGEWRDGQSIGKKLMRLRVADMQGRPASKKQILHRNLRKFVDMVAFPFLILPLISPLRQRLGDMVAHTIVVSVPELDKPEVSAGDDPSTQDDDQDDRDDT